MADDNNDENDDENNNMVPNEEEEKEEEEEVDCEPEKPICFNYTKDGNKNILYNCDGSPYNIFEALEAAYAIKNNENDNKYDKYKLKQCINNAENNAENKANEGFKKQNTCTCTNFDSVWMTAIKQAERQSKIIQNEFDKPEFDDTVKKTIINVDKTKIENIQKDYSEKVKVQLHGKSQTELISGFFKTIAASMEKNKNKNDNTEFIELFCKSVNMAINSTDDDLDDETVKKLLVFDEKTDEGLKKAAVNIFKGIYVLTRKTESEEGATVEADATAEEEEEEEEEEEATEEAVEEEATAEANAEANANAKAVTELLKKTIEIVAKLFNIGNYVLEDSRHFDKAAFISTGELFKECYENPISSTSSVLPGGQKGGICNGKLAAMGGFGIIGTFMATIAVGVLTMGVGVIVGLIVLGIHSAIVSGNCIHEDYTSESRTLARKQKKEQKKEKKFEKIEKKEEKKNKEKLEQRITQYEKGDIVYHRTDNEEYYGKILNVNSKKNQVEIEILFKNEESRARPEFKIIKDIKFNFDIGINDKLYKKRNEVPLRIRGTDLIKKKQSNTVTDMFIIREIVNELIKAKSIDGNDITDENLKEIFYENKNFDEEYDAYKETDFDENQEASGGRKTHSQNKRHTRTKKRKTNKKTNKKKYTIKKKKITKKRKATKRRKTTKK